VPLTSRAPAALDAIPPRLDTSLIFPASGGGLMNLNNFRKRQWAPAIEASGVRRPARIYDLRATFASEALAAGVSIFELARVMGTSVLMIERAYGTLLDGAGAGMPPDSTPTKHVWATSRPRAKGPRFGPLRSNLHRCRDCR
jgi:hypothetical protein